MYKQYTDGNKTIKATEKAYKVLYKGRGFKPVENKALKQPAEEEKLENDVLGIEEYSKAEIIKILKDKGIKHNQRDTLPILYNLLIGSD